MTTTTKTDRKIIVRKTTKAKAAPATLYRFLKVPMGNILIAYTLGLISAQIGGITARKTFKLWPAGNFSGHVAKKELVKVEGGYQLTEQGAAYFAMGVDKCGKDALVKMVAATKSGKQPDIWNYPMVAL